MTGLIGKIIRYTIPNDLESVAISQVEADLGGGYILVRSLAFRTGADIGSGYILTLAWLASVAGDCDVFDSWEALQEENAKYEAIAASAGAGQLQ